MSLYTPVPLELVLDGFGREPGPFVDVMIRGVTMRVLPVAPGIGRIERLLSAPLGCFLQPEFSPGHTVCYNEGAVLSDSAVDSPYSEEPTFPL